MVNPFDRNFFKFFAGFVCILGVSFSVLYIVGVYAKTSGIETLAGQK